MDIAWLRCEWIALSCQLGLRQRCHECFCFRKFALVLTVTLWVTVGEVTGNINLLSVLFMCVGMFTGMFSPKKIKRKASQS